ncbi:hypothetical protein CTAYLR_002528 [Chrysophaeum taylorii]|uniref:Glycosyltransferase n=1 Tax=Chrysophaeum taylorii TaxID=2483200 RepID=A0AAD7UF81_9STRA|nr:hypothetical protein CTAYLR_002528 [Chrysophaeum taylorii]
MRSWWWWWWWWWWFFVVVCQGSRVWLVRPQSGSVLAPGDQELEIALELDNNNNNNNNNGTRLSSSVCVGAARLGGGEEGAKKACFDATVDGPQDEIKTSRTSLRLETEGWYYVDVSLGASSRFAVGVFVSGPTERPPRRRLGLAWDLGGGIGWGVAGLHIALTLEEMGVLAVPLRRVHGLEMSPAQRAKMLASVRATTRGPLDFPVLHALGRWGANGTLGRMDDDAWSTCSNFGLLFAETLDWPSTDLEHLARFDVLFVGSRWLARGIEGAAENAAIRLPEIRTFAQGVATDVFSPPTVVVRTVPRFRIFSGGKLEWRKGHDIVVEAFRLFRAAHPEADPELVVAWVNPWRQPLETISAATHTRGVPRTAETPADDALAIQEWLHANGIADAVSLPPLPHHRVPELLRSVDVAIFPNRAEGGTNLVAMEAVAMAVPTILSANTGHLDLLDALGDHACWPLLLQTETTVSLPDGISAAGNESDPAEAAAALARVFTHRTQERAKARRAAEIMRAWGWKPSVADLLQTAFAPPTGG